MRTKEKFQWGGLILVILLLIFLGFVIGSISMQYIMFKGQNWALSCNKDTKVGFVLSEFCEDKGKDLRGFSYGYEGYIVQCDDIHYKLFYDEYD